MAFLAIVLIVGQSAIVGALLYVARRFEGLAASNALLSHQVAQSLAEIARMQATYTNRGQR